MSEFFRHGLAARLRPAALVVVVAVIIVLVFYSPGLGATPLPVPGGA